MSFSSTSDDLRRRPLLAGVVAVLVAIALLAAAASAQAARRVRPVTAVPAAKIVNFDRSAPRPTGYPHGAQVVKLDVDGNAVEAKADFITHFGTWYYLYGESYDCLYLFYPRPGFCGFRQYRSRDLVHWRSLGRFIDPFKSQFAHDTCAMATGCWGPTVVYSPELRKYVLWFYRAIGVPVDPPLVVMTSDSPTGPWEHPTVPNVPGGFAQDVFIDDDGTGYLSWGSPSSGLHIQQLNDAYTDVVGQATTVTLPGGRFTDPRCQPPGGFAGADFQNQTPALLAAWKACGMTESPSIVKHDGRYFMTFSDPICAFCLGTETSYFVASRPLGPWTGVNGSPSYDPANPGRFDPYSLSPDTCGGQPFHIAHLPTADGRVVELFAGVLWANSRNEGSANHYWEPLRFENGLMQELRCGNVKVPLASDSKALRKPAPPRAINLPAIGAGSTVRQSFTVPENGTIRSLELPIYQKTNPTRPFAAEGLASTPLTITLSGPGTAVVKTIAPEDVLWSPTRVRIPFDVTVARGARMRVTLSSDTPQGHYATLFDAHDPYPGGRLSGTGDAASLVSASSDLLLTVTVSTRHGRIAFGG